MNYKLVTPRVTRSQYQWSIKQPDFSNLRLRNPYETQETNELNIEYRTGGSPNLHKNWKWRWICILAMDVKISLYSFYIHDFSSFWNELLKIRYIGKRGIIKCLIMFYYIGNYLPECSSKNGSRNGYNLTNLLYER